MTSRFSAASDSSSEESSGEELYSEEEESEEEVSEEESDEGSDDVKGAYFKSTDGHYNAWRFSLRRPNLHLLPIAVSNGGKGCVRFAAFASTC